MAKLSNSKDIFEFLEDIAAQGLSLQGLRERMWTEYGRRRAVLVLDSTGFSRTTKEMGIVYFLLALQRARKVISEAAATHGAMRQRAEADNFYAEFYTADDAFLAASAIRDAVAEARIPLVGNENYSVAIGIGFGDFLQSEHEGLYGSEMNLASKLGEDIGKPGEILLTDQAFQALSDQHKGSQATKSTEMSGVVINYHVF